MPNDLVTYHIHRHNRLVHDARSYRQRCDKIAELFSPAERNFQSGTTILDGNVHHEDILDSYPATVVNEFAAKFTEILIGGSKSWFDLKFKNFDLQSDIPAQEWLEKVKDIIYQHLSSPDSHFVGELYFILRSVALFGIGVFYSMESKGRDDEDVVFITYPAHQFVYALSYKEEIDTVYREFELTAREVLQYFPNIDEEVKKGLKESYSNFGSDERKFKILHCVYPNEDITRLSYIYEKEFESSKSKNFHSLYILIKGGDYQEKSNSIILEESGFYEMPYIIARWKKPIYPSIYPHSPSMDAEANVRTLYSVIDSFIGLVQKDLTPSLMTTMTDEDLIQRVSEPGSIIPVNRNDVIQPISTNHNNSYPIGMDFINYLKSGIDRAYHLDKIRPISEGPPQKTATQVQSHQFYNLAEVAAVVNRLYDNFFVKIVERTFGILSRKGKIPEFPYNIQKTKMNVEIVNPVTESYKTQNTQNIQTFLNLIIPMIQANPQIMLVVDEQELLYMLAKYLNIDERVLRSRSEVEQIKQSILEEQQRQQQMQERQQQMQEAQQGAQAVNQATQARQNANGGVQNAT